MKRQITVQCDCGEQHFEEFQRWAGTTLAEISLAINRSKE